MPSFPHADKLVHAIMMLAWMVSASYDYTRKKRPPLSRLPLRYCIVICLMTILFGGVIEIAQSLMDTGRNADILDFAADALGALAGMLAVPVLMPLLVRH